MGERTLKNKINLYVNEPLKNAVKIIIIFHTAISDEMPLERRL